MVRSVALTYNSSSVVQCPVKLTKCVSSLKKKLQFLHVLEFEHLFFYTGFEHFLNYLLILNGFIK